MRKLISMGHSSAHAQGSQGEEARYTDFKQRRRRSPPRYERAVLERLHEARTQGGYSRA